MGRPPTSSASRPEPRLRPWQWAALASIVLAALAVRLDPVLRHPEPARNGVGVFGDSFVYHTLAFNLVMGHGYSGTRNHDTFGDGPPDPRIFYQPAIFRGPVYPAFLAAIYAASHRGPAPPSPAQWRMIWTRVRMIQCALDALVCLAVFGIVMTLIPERPWLGLLAAALYAGSVYNIYYSRALLSETVTTALMACWIWAMAASWKRPTLVRFGLTGACWGLVCLSRTEYVLFGPLLVAVWWISQRPTRRALLTLGGALVCAAAVIILPWSSRNARVFHRPILISAGGLGGNLYFGAVLTRDNWAWWWTEQYPDHLFMDQQEKAAFLAARERFYTTLVDGTLEDLYARDRVFLAMTAERLRRQPWDCVKNWLLKIPRLWYLDSIPFYAYPEPSGWFMAGYLLLALFGSVRLPRARRLLSVPVWLVCGYLTLLLIPFHVESRYSAPLVPGLIALAGIGLGALMRPRHLATAVA